MSQNKLSDEFMVYLDTLTSDSTYWADLIKECRLAGELIDDPDLANKCDFSKLSSYHIVRILIKRPELAHKCDFNKILDYKWIELLQDMPIYADKCQWGDFDSNNLVYLIKAQPILIDRCNLSILDSDNWFDLIDNCVFGWLKYTDKDTTRLMNTYPEFLKFIRYMESNYTCT